MTIRENSYFISHNKVDIFHFGYNEEENNLSTKNDRVVEQFRTIEELQSRYLQLTGISLNPIEIENLTPTFLAKYGRKTSYLSFRKQDVYTPLPLEAVLLREKFKVYVNGELVANPTIKQMFESVDPLVMTYIKLYNTTEYEIEELNQLATMQAQLESNGVYKTFPPPGSTVFTYDELLAFNWDIV
jgi:hypothetical protein